MRREPWAPRAGFRSPATTWFRDGTGSQVFTSRQAVHIALTTIISQFCLRKLRRLNRAEIALIADYAKARLDSLTPEQQESFRRNAGAFMVAWMTDRLFRDLVEFELPRQ